MERDRSPGRLKDALIAIPAVWLIIVISGAAGMPLQPSFAGALLSLAVYLMLLSAFSRFSLAGRRAGLILYLVAAVLYVPVCIAVFFMLPFWYQPPGWFDWLSAGQSIGFMGSNENVTTLSYFVRLAVNLLGPILVVVGMRDLRRATI